MKLQIVAKDIELTEHLKEVIDQKLGSDIDKFLPAMEEDLKIAEIRIEQGSRWGNKVSFSMWLPKKEHIYAEEKDKNLETAINSLKDEVQREIRRYKEKLQDYRE